VERLTVKRPDGRWAIASSDNASPTERVMKIPEVIDRLAAYEDTDRTPDEIEKLKKKALTLEVYKAIGTTEHLRELVEAEQEGRLVVLKEGEGNGQGS